MAYIYKITNDINGKQYIGKTERTIEQRFIEHCQNYKKEKLEKRPLYAAMRKYGIEHFHIELIEETSDPEEREKYWIEYFGTFKNGYNATIGGDGRAYIDYDLVVATYKNILNTTKVAEILNINKDTVRDILKIKNIPIKTSSEINKEQSGKNVGLFKDNKLIKVFSSTRDAARYVIEEKLTTSKDIKGIAAHIHQVCIGKRKTAYTFLWKYI